MTLTEVVRVFRAASNSGIIVQVEDCSPQFSFEEMARRSDTGFMVTLKVIGKPGKTKPKHYHEALDYIIFHRAERMITMLKRA